MAEYTIVEVVPMMDIDRRGKFVKIYRVKFEYNGIEDFVDVPEGEYKPEKVREKIEEVIRTHRDLLK